MSKVMRAIGLMSGTSMDGIDVALIETDGDVVAGHGPHASYPYSGSFRHRLRGVLEAAKTISDRKARPGTLRRVEIELTDLHVQAVEDFLDRNKLDRAQIDVIGFHGQTVLHRPEWTAEVGMPVALLDAPAVLPRPHVLTVQIGDGTRLARALGVDVVYDLRAADCDAGGQGAPLAPVYHWALRDRVPELPAAFLNIGGVANLSYLGRDGRLIAFDTGPGNALLDDWVARTTTDPFDRGGRLAMAGSVQRDALRQLMAHGYFGLPYPKSLDRTTFDPAPWLDGLRPEDGAATLVAFTSAAVREAAALLPEPPAYWIVSGGGRLNAAIMRRLAEDLGAAVAPIEAIGLDGDSIEAEAWAYLAVRSLKGLPITFPGTTGVTEPMTGGVLARGRRGVGMVRAYSSFLVRRISTIFVST
jgi:anhydro-N-acetylmuramic acid kinase